MKQLSTQLQKGFTLIELLVVIGILGILAAALIATIDPFEQLRKGTDTTLRNTAIEIVNASTRYYGARNAYPWEDASVNGGDCDGADGVLQVGALTTKTDCIQELAEFGELKANFENNTAILKDIYVSQVDADSTLFACFVPQSKQLRLDPNTRYNNIGEPAASGCPSASSTTCHYCVQ